MDSLVRYAADLIKPQADAKGVTIDIDAQPLYTYGNPALLSELIMNLLDNSVKYNHQGGHISVRLAPEGEDKLTISVSDNGIGIPKEKQEESSKDSTAPTKAAPRQRVEAAWVLPSASILSKNIRVL